MPSGDPCVVWVFNSVESFLSLYYLRENNNSAVRNGDFLGSCVFPVRILQGL
jgi:hypothetical protein